MPDFFPESGKKNTILFSLDLMGKNMTGDLEMDSGHHWVPIISDKTYSFEFLALSVKDSRH